MSKTKLISVTLTAIISVIASLYFFITQGIQLSYHPVKGAESYLQNTLLWLFLIIPIIGVFLSVYFYKKNKFKASLTLSALPIIYIILLFSGFYIYSISTHSTF